MSNDVKRLATQQVGGIERKSPNYVQCATRWNIWPTGASATIGQSVGLLTELWRIADIHHGIRVELLTGFVDDVGHVS